MILLAVVAAVVVGAAVFLYSRYSETDAVMDKSLYYGFTSTDQAALVVNDEILGSFGIVRDGKIYIDYNAVSQYFNSDFYWDSSVNSLLLTMPSGTQAWSPEDGSGNVLSENGDIYISADCVENYSDIDMQTFSDPYRVVARTAWNNITAETVTADTAVRYRGGPKSEILTQVKAGDTVVLTSSADDWCGVSTSDGYIGYVRKKDIETAPGNTITHTADEKFVFQKLSAGHKICMAWQFTQNDDGSGEFQTLTAGASCLNTISPTWFTFGDNSGTLNSLASADYVTAAHNAGMQVWGCLQDTAGSGFSSAEILAGKQNRENIINQLLSICAETGMDGINIDIETISEESAGQYLQFLRELCVAAHAQNIIVSVDNYVPLYTSYLNRGEQAKCVDYLVIMGYDEHTAGSEEAGPVASISFVEQGITDTLSEASPDQVINAVPFYTRGWTISQDGGEPSSEALGMNDADSWASGHGINLSWDPTVGESTGQAQSDGVTYRIWLEDEKALEEKMKLVEKYDLAGVAAWRLGFERDDVWDIIGKYIR